MIPTHALTLADARVAEGLERLAGLLRAAPPTNTLL